MRVSPLSLSLTGLVLVYALPGYAAIKPLHPTGGLVSPAVESLPLYPTVNRVILYRAADVVTLPENLSAATALALQGNDRFRNFQSMAGLLLRANTPFGEPGPIAVMATTRAISIAREQSNFVGFFRMDKENAYLQSLPGRERVEFIKHYAHGVRTDDFSAAHTFLENFFEGRDARNDAVINRNREKW